MLARIFMLLLMPLPIVLAQQSDVAPVDEKQTTLSAADRQRIDELIEHLSSSKFAEREDAVAELIQFGELAIPQLVTAADMPDAEVRLRIRILLARLSHNNFESAVTAFVSGASDEMDGWTFSRKLIGDSPASRELFIDAARQHRELMVELDKGPGERLLAANKTADLIIRRATVEFVPPERGDAVALLLICGDQSTPISPTVERVIVRMMNSQIASQTLKDAMLAPVFQQLVGFWMQRASVSYQPQALFFALQHSIPASITLARNVLQEFMATDAKLTGEQAVDANYSESLEQALLVTAKYGEASDVKRLEPLIRDARQMPIRTDQPDDSTEPMVVQVRDIAMAVAIKLLGGDLVAAGYNNPREHSRVVFFTGSLGFPGEDDILRAKPAKYLADLLSKK